MHDDFPVRHLAPDEVHLRFHDRHVAMRSALKDELAPGRTKILKLPGVDPDVDRQHRGERGHDLLGRPALALLVHDVGLEEHPAAHGQGRHRLRLEGAVRIALERDVVALGHALQERAVAGGALGVQPEVGDGALPQDHDLHVGAADVADHVGIGHVVQGGRRVRDRFDDGDVGANHITQQVFAIAGQGEPTDVVEARFAQLREQRLRIFDGIAFGQGVTREE